MGVMDVLAAMTGAIVGTVIGVAIDVAKETISGSLDRDKLCNFMKDKGIKAGLLKTVKKCDSIIILEDLDYKIEYEIHGDNIADDVIEGDIIYI